MKNDKKVPKIVVTTFGVDVRKAEEGFLLFFRGSTKKGKIYDFEVKLF